MRASFSLRRRDQNHSKHTSDLHLSLIHGHDPSLLPSNGVLIPWPSSNSPLCTYRTSSLQVPGEALGLSQRIQVAEYTSCPSFHIALKYAVALDQEEAMVLAAALATPAFWVSQCRSPRSRRMRPLPIPVHRHRLVPQIQPILVLRRPPRHRLGPHIYPLLLCRHDLPLVFQTSLFKGLQLDL
jgi:hypothetical protein